jgi:hypothetical protein
MAKPIIAESHKHRYDITEAYDIGTKETGDVAL